MATHSSVLAWRIPGTGEPGGLPSVGSQSQTRLSDLAAAFPEMLLLAATHCSTCTTTYGGSVIPHHFSVEPSLHQLIGKGEKSRSPFMLRADRKSVV